MDISDITIASISIPRYPSLSEHDFIVVTVTGPMPEPMPEPTPRAMSLSVAISEAMSMATMTPCLIGPCGAKRSHVGPQADELLQIDFSRIKTFLHVFVLSCNLGSTAAPFPILPRHIFMSAPPKMRPAVPVSVSGAPVPVTVSSGVPMQVVSKSAAYPAGAPITYYRPPGPGVPGPAQVTYPAGYVGSGPTAVPQGRVIQSVTTPVGQAPGRIVRTSQATQLPLSKSPPMGQPTRPNTVGGPAYSQSAYETKHEKDEQLQNLKLGRCCGNSGNGWELRKTCGLKEIPVNDGLQAFKKGGSDPSGDDESFSKLTREKFVETYSALLQDHKVEVPSDEVKNAVFDLFDRDDNNVVDMMELVCGISLLCKGSE
eukprot:s131_g1.t1